MGCSLLKPETRLNQTLLYSREYPLTSTLSGPDPIRFMVMQLMWTGVSWWEVINTRSGTGIKWICLVLSLCLCPLWPSPWCLLLGCVYVKCDYQLASLRMMHRGSLWVSASSSSSPLQTRSGRKGCPAPWQFDPYEVLDTWWVGEVGGRTPILPPERFAQVAVSSFKRCSCCRLDDPHQPVEPSAWSVCMWGRMHFQKHFCLCILYNLSLARR